VGALIGGGLAALVLWQARAPAAGAIFAGAAAAALGLLALAARLAPGLVRRLPRLPWLAWRQGLAGLDRPGGEARGVVVALGIGVMLLSAVALLERALGDQLDLERRREAPSFFFVDLQPDQTEAFTRLLAEVAPGTRPALTPVVRARLAAIDGQPVTRARWEGRQDAWRFTREYVLTYAADLPAGDVVTRGRWWGEDGAAGGPRVSVEDETARALGVDVGERLTFDVQGVPVEAEVASLRRVDWQALSMNFFVVFAPGALESAPLAYVATARVPPERETAVQDRVAAAFPNVTAVPLRDVLDRVAGVLDRIAIAVRLVAAFVILAGLVVMVGALATSRAQRLYESVLLKTLGATRGLVARAFAVEYGCLGLLAGLGGTALGAVLAWVVLRLVLEVPFRPAAAPLAASVGLSVGLALVVGALGTFRLLGQPPLTLLRRE
jgi:putative ABC transport system permease protein